MVNILEKHDEVLSQKAGMNGAEYFKRSNLEIREWDIFGCMCKLLRDAGHFVPTYALKSESPDFHTFDEDANPSWPVEITEVLEPKYRRGDFWGSDPFKGGPIDFTPQPLDDVWSSLRSVIVSKGSRNYPEDTRLFIYFNISISAFNDLGTSFDHQLLAENSNRPFSGIEKFAQVFVMSADMTGLVRLHPRPEILASCQSFEHATRSL